MACDLCSARVKTTGKVQIEATYTDTGRCCIAGVCSITTEGGCAGSWWGAGTVCGGGDVGNYCIYFGACCRDAVCTVENEIDCDGAYLGHWTTCVGDPCDDPSGECCRGGVCTVTTEGLCSDGNWSVTGTCSPNPCPDTPRVLSFF